MVFFKQKDTIRDTLIVNLHTSKYNRLVIYQWRILYNVRN